MIRKMVRLATGIVALGLILGVAGCSEDGNQWQRLVCEVESVNSGMPLVSAYLDSGSDNIVNTDDDVLPIDFVSVTFHARPYNDVITLPEDGTYSYFDVVSYDLVWHPGPGAPAAMTDFNIHDAPCATRIPVYGEGSVAILVADRQMKEQPWFIALYNDNSLSFSANAELIFHGHESGSDEIVDVPAGLLVTFFGVVSTN